MKFIQILQNAMLNKVSGMDALFLIAIPQLNDYIPLELNKMNITLDLYFH
jgi:hypothetical protein